MELQDKILQLKKFLPNVKLIPALLSDDLDFVEHTLLDFMDLFDEIEFDIVMQDFSKIVNNSQMDLTLKLPEYIEILQELEINNSIKSNFHLMENNFISEFDELDQNLFSDSEFTIHIESEFFKRENWIHKFSRFDEWNMGFAINPDTQVSKLCKMQNDWDTFWNKYDEKRKLFDFVQIMSVVPGSQGHDFDKVAIRNISECKHEFKNMKIRVDGGIKPDNLAKLSEKDLTILKLVDEVCVGSYFMNQI